MSSWYGECGYMVEIGLWSWLSRLCHCEYYLTILMDCPRSSDHPSVTHPVD
jgi:hypothetical protein